MNQIGLERSARWSSWLGGWGGAWETWMGGHWISWGRLRDSPELKVWIRKRNRSADGRTDSLSSLLMLRYLLQSSFLSGKGGFLSKHESLNELWNDFLSCDKLDRASESETRKEGRKERPFAKKRQCPPGAHSVLTGCPPGAHSHNIFLPPQSEQVRVALRQK